METRPLETMPIPKLLPKTALPCVVAMVGTGVANLTTALFASPLGQETLAALGIVFSALTLLQALGYTIALGGSTLFSPSLGNAPQKSGTIATVTLQMDIITGTVLGIIGFFLATPICKGLGATSTLLPLCVAYAKPIFLATPFTFANYAFGCLLRCVGKSTAAMIGLLAGTVLTIGGTPFCFFLLSTGIKGAGFSFLAGQGLSFILLWLSYRKTKEFMKTTPPTPTLCLKIIYYGMSSFLRQGFASLSLIVLNRTAKVYGTEILAALSLCTRITGLAYSALLGWGQGFAPIGGYAFGKKNFSRLYQAFSYGVKTATLGMSLLGGGLFLYALTTTPPIRYLLLSSAVTFPFIPLSVFATYGYQCMKRPFVATLLSCLRQGILLIPLYYLLPILWGTVGLLVAGGIADLLTFALCLIPFLRLKESLSCFSKGKVI